MLCPMLLIESLGHWGGTTEPRILRRTRDVLGCEKPATDNRALGASAIGVWRFGVSPRRPLKAERSAPFIGKLSGDFLQYEEGH